MTTWTRPTILNPDRAAEAHEHLTAYFTGTRYSGSFFEAVGDGGNSPDVANRVTSDDLVALATLSVPVQGSAARELLAGETGRRVSEILSTIPADASLSDERGRALLLSSEVLAAWQAIREVHTFGPVRTSKLLARKRPHLVPIYDRHIKDQFRAAHSGDQWSTWVEMFEDDALVAHLTSLRSEAGVPANVSLLRVLDVVVWMAGKGETVTPDVSAEVDDEV